MVYKTADPQTADPETADPETAARADAGPEAASRPAADPLRPYVPHSGQCTRANEVIALVGDKWSVHIVMLLGTGCHRFMEIKRAIDGISQKMLTVTLRGLERDGYVTRTVYPTIPPKVEYELTDLGRDLLHPLRALGAWALHNHDRVVAARMTYDARANAEQGKSA